MFDVALLLMLLLLLIGKSTTSEPGKNSQMHEAPWKSGASAPRKGSQIQCGL
jgi:hypothetical protein